MGKGAKQKSNVILMASGSKHARVNEPKLKTPIGPPPLKFKGVALETWRLTIAAMAEAGTIFEADRQALEKFCLATQNRSNLQDFVDLEGVMIDDPMKGWVVNPALRQIKQEDGTILRYLAEFGLTPASRGKVIAPPAAEINPFDNL